MLKPRLHILAVALLSFLVGCSSNVENISEDKDSLTTDFQPIIQFSITEFNSKFEVQVAEVDASDPCRLVKPGQKVCLRAIFATGELLELEGPLDQNISGMCAEAQLTGQINTLPSSDIVDVDFELLNDFASCQANKPLAEGGSVIASTQLKSIAPGSSGGLLYKLDLLADYQMNALPLANNLQRYDHTATLLPSGSVLIAGGATSDGTLTDELLLFDPTTNQLASGGKLACARRKHAAILVPNNAPLVHTTIAGKVLIFGGEEACGQSGKQRIEVYDPATGSIDFLRDETSGLDIIFPAEVASPGTAYLKSKGEILVSGGREPGSGQPVACEFANHVIDLVSVSLKVPSDPPPPQEFAPPPSPICWKGSGPNVADNIVMPYAGPDGNEVALSLSGTTDNNWTALSYYTEGVLYSSGIGTTLFGFSDYLTDNPRHLATNILVAENPTTQLILGGRHFNFNSTPGLTVLSDVLPLSPGNPLNTPMSASMLNPRFNMQTLNLGSADTVQSLNSHLIVGGGEANDPFDPQNSKSQASRALEVLLVNNDASQGCFVPLQTVDPVNPSGPPLNLSLVYPRYAHTATRLEDGRVFVFGGVSGELDPNPSNIAGISSDAAQPVSSYEILPSYAPPTACP